MTPAYRQWRRRGTRRAYSVSCEAHSIEDWRPLGGTVLDMSPHGALLCCDARARVGEGLIMSFQMPWRGPMVHVRARVERVIEGSREDDVGYAVAIRFHRLAERDRLELAYRLAPFPKVSAKRPHPTDYARLIGRIRGGLEQLPEIVNRVTRSI